jgi:hypothetical protein
MMCIIYITSEQSSSNSNMPLSTAPPSLPNSPFRHDPSSSTPRHDNDNDITRELKRLRSDLNDLHPDACVASVVTASVDSTASIAVDAIHADAPKNNVVITSASSDEGGIVLPSSNNIATTNNNNSSNKNNTQQVLTSDVSTILSKIQEITKIENSIIVQQRDEICKLRCELQLLQQQQQQKHLEKMIVSSANKSTVAPTSQLVVQSTLSFSDSITMESTHSDSTRSNTSSSRGSHNSNSSSSSASSSNNSNMFNNDDDDYSTMDNTNEGSAISERNTPYTLTTMNDTQLSTKNSLSLQSMIATSTAELQSITMRKEEAVLQLEELTSNIQQATATYHQLTTTNNQLQAEIQKTQDSNAQLLNERNKLMGEIEIYNDQIEVHNLLSQAQSENAVLTRKVEELQLQLLKEKEKNAIMLPSQQGEVIEEEKEEEEREDAIDDNVNPNDDDEARDDIEDPRGGNDDDEYGRDRTYTGGSDTVSALHDADTISVLFDQDFTSKQQQQQQPAMTTTTSSIKSEHDNIRLHAEKMLYWANRAEERSTKKKMKSSSNSVTSLTEESSSTVVDRNTTTTNMLNNSISGDVDPNGITGVTKPVTTTAVSVASSVTASAMIPMTIGLPPRSQSRVHRSERSLLLPPRCPTPPNTSSQSITTTGTTTNPTSSPQGSNSTLSCTSDKENGGTNGGFVPGAFPKFARRTSGSNKTVRMTEIPVTITQHDDVEDASFVGKQQQNQQHQTFVCECKASPFSGNDPQSEFYLPKLGLACNCGYDNNDRVNFTNDPTSLTNILRKWQCDFLVTLGVCTADQLLHAHKEDANGMARKMKEWRSKNSNAINCGVVEVGTRSSRECYVALKIWSRTCKVVLRSIREQKHRARLAAMAAAEEGGIDSGEYDSDGVVIEKPHFLDISFADGTNTITSISTLGQFSSVCGGRSFEMMEI